MLTLVFVVIFGVAFSVFATLNTSSIDINFGFQKLSGVPIYLAVLVSCAIGMLMAAIIYFLRFLSASLTIGDKEKDLKDANKRISELTRDLHKLELENTKLKSQLGKEDFDEETLG